MWIFTNDAFVSAVQDKKDPTKIMVRGRIPGDVEAFVKPVLPTPTSIKMNTGMDVVETNDADYRFRVLLSRRQFEEIMAFRAKTIDYTNFKDSIDESKPLGRQRHDVYLEVWRVMYGWQHRVRGSWDKVKALAKG